LKGRGFNSLRKNSGFDFVLKGRGFKSLRKNSGFDFALKGRGFKPRRKCHKINPALAAELLGSCFSANCKAVQNCRVGGIAEAMP
jgi:hypothetical protein